MITLYRSQIKRLRAIFARGLGSSGRSAQIPVQFRLAGGNLTIAAQTADRAILYTMPLDRPEQTFAVTVEMFRRLAGGKNEPVTIELDDQHVCARWTDAGIPQVARFDLLEPADLPPLPTEMATNDAELIDALQIAAETASDENTRYALSCLRFRGRDGQIAATDGRQMLLQHGFSFPWEDEVLVDVGKIFNGKDLKCGEPVMIGRVEDWLTMKTGPWTLHFRIEKEARFPQVDDFVHPPGVVAATMQLSPADAEFLGDSVMRLPSHDSYHLPVTVDLNGHVIVRARNENDATPTEIVLQNSRLQGEPLRASSNRRYLARAMQLGFQNVEFMSAEAPAVCRDDRRAYLWALLGKDDVIQPRDDAVRIESPFTPVTVRSVRTVAQTNPRRRNEPFMATTKNSEPSPSKNSPRVTSSEDRPVDRRTLPELIENAEGLRQTLRDTLTQVNDVITGLKQHHRQSKRLRTAVRSLKELQAIEA